MAKRENFSMRLAAPISRVWRHPAGYLEGCVFTPNGIVGVYSQGGKGETPCTNLDFVWDGRLHSRRIPQRYTQRGLVTVANRYADEIRGGKAWLD